MPKRLGSSNCWAMKKASGAAANVMTRLSPSGSNRATRDAGVSIALASDPGVAAELTGSPALRLTLPGSAMLSQGARGGRMVPECRRQLRGFRYAGVLAPAAAKPSAKGVGVLLDPLPERGGRAAEQFW